jgi:phosphate transport system substrate-binding protein
MAVAAVIAGLIAGPAQAAGPKITLSGQQITASLVADLAYFYRHAVTAPPRFQITGGGTAAGIADAARGITDGALVSRDLIATDPPGMQMTPIALSAVCLVTNKANPVPGLTRAQIQDIVAARTATWSEIPGATRTGPIVSVELAPTTGAGQVFESVFVDATTPLAWNPVTLLTNAQARDFVASEPDAIGYVDLALTGPLHVAAYEGVPCTRATVRDGSYAARRPLGIATRGQPTSALRRFLRWVKTSPAARRVIASRYIPQ